MKKFFEKHDLFKLAGIFMFIAIILSWLCSYSYYAEGTLTTTEITRVGLFDISTYTLLGLYYFTVIFVFIFIAAGFYKFLGTTAAYQKLTDKIANVFKGKEKIFVALSTLVFACLTGVSTEYFVLLALIPFALTILSKLRVEKVVGLSATFGGMLVGILGSTYSTKIVGNLVDATYGLGVSYGYELVSVIVLFVIAYMLLTYFAFARMNKTNKNSSILEDPFASSEVIVEKKTKKKVKEVKVSTIPLVIVLIITFALIILAFIGWETAFGVSVFTNVYNWITQATVFDETVYSYILGSSLQVFGKWDLLSAAGVLFLATLIIKVIYHIPFDKVIESYGDGFKKISKSVVLLLVIYSILEFSVIYPTIPGLVDKIMGLGSNIFTLFFSGVLTNTFTVEFQYTVSLVGSLFKNFESLNVAALALQTSFGVVSFIAPTSAILMLGLSMLDIKFKDWVKYIWQFVLAITIVVFIILAILMYV